ncbi:MAG: superoxide dismutase [Candidatus Buchananbacteria bacterium CG10_big_fil_rev_8_21_14_0_10_42_9]|uniref:Superoxide dismutase n=1 Tax=Candidatus Buchananbacteria bacterium CG10_big_fil_rev_8_21_14_0_10_42_9 TaxID=1974526 RepID=A0A2H0W1P0_9BACT|nr:MAG: superoxide dismutase [Candidatus Buchananbacteria bacterium CG10_big_fil_rev_8_21_14_0_10_42_9]
MSDYSVKDLGFKAGSLKGISEKQITIHHDVHYAAYVKARNAISEKLRKIRESGEYESIRAVKQAESHNVSGMVLHEIYWDNLGGDGSQPKGDLLKQIESDFGSYANWEAEAKAIAMSTRGWALLVYDLDHKTLHNASVDYHDQGAWWNCVPIVAIDMWEHAFYLDQGPNKGDYLDAYFENLNWGRAEEKFAALSKLDWK